MIPDLNEPVLYACVAHGATVLAELVPGGGGGDVTSVARRCLAVAPPFHREYSHTAGGRIYAFAMADPLVFFAIADASFGAPRAFLFLRRLRLSAAASAASGAPFSLQFELLPELRRLALALPDELDDPPPPSPSSSPSPSPPPPPPPTPPSPLNETNNEPPKPGTEEEKKRKKKKKKKKKHPLDGGDGAMEISVAADATDPLPKPMRISWRRHLRAILLIDLAVCGLLFGIWISVCKGFHCIRR